MFMASSSKSNNRGIKLFIIALIIVLAFVIILNFDLLKPGLTFIWNFFTTPIIKLFFNNS